MTDHELQTKFEFSRKFKVQDSENGYNGDDDDSSETDENDDKTQLIPEMLESPSHAKKWSTIFSDSGLPANSFNFINSIIGSGVIGMPLVFAQTGIFVSLALFALIFFLADYSLLVLISSGNKMGASSYQEMVHLVLGKWGYALLSLLQFSYPYISLISYNTIIGDTVTKVATRLFDVSSDSLLNNRIFVISMVSLFVTFPLCSLKKISKLAKTSLMSCLLLIFVTAVMIARLITLRNRIPVDFGNFYSEKMKILDASNSFSIMAFAFMTHHNSFLIYNSLKNPNYSDWKKVTHASVFGSILFCILFGLVGYLTFGAATQGDIFENYCFKDDLVNIARFAYSIIIMFSFPLEGVVCREVLQNLVSGLGRPELFHWLFALLVVSSSVLISFTNDCLGIVLIVNGSITATSMAYILPSLCTIIIRFKKENQRYIRHYIVPVVVLLIGVFFVVSGVLSIVQQSIDGASCLHGIEPDYCQKLIINPRIRNYSAAQNQTSLF